MVFLIILIQFFVLLMPLLFLIILQEMNFLYFHRYLDLFHLKLYDYIFISFILLFRNQTYISKILKFSSLYKNSFGKWFSSLFSFLFSSLICLRIYSKCFRAKIFLMSFSFSQSSGNYLHIKFNSFLK